MVAGAGGARAGTPKMTSLVGDPRAHVLRKKVMNEWVFGADGPPPSADPGASLPPPPPSQPLTRQPDLCTRLPAQILALGFLLPSRPNLSPFSRGTLLSLLRRITSGYHRDPQPTSPEAHRATPCGHEGLGGAWTPLPRVSSCIPHASSPEATEPTFH